MAKLTSLGVYVCIRKIKNSNSFMNIITLSDARQSQVVNVFTPVMKLFFQANMTIIGLTTTNQLAKFYEALASAKLTVKKQFKGGETITMIDDLPLLDVIEISTNNEGFIQLTKNGGVLRSVFSLELSNDGAIVADDKDFLVVDVNLTGTTATNLDFKVNTISAPVATSEILSYQPKVVFADNMVSFPTGNAYAVVVPKTTNKLKLKHSTGMDMELEPSELENIALDTNDISYIIDGSVQSTCNWRVIPLVGCYQVDVKVPVEGKIYFLSNI